MKIEWSDPMWEDRVRVALGHPRHGWVQLAFMTAAFNQGVIVRCSDVFCPFPAAEAWLRRIKGGQLPARLLIDEEGPSKLLLACPLEADPSRFSFYVSADPYWSGDLTDDKDLLLKCKTDRLQFVRDFGSEVSRWLNEDWTPVLYGGRCDEGDEENHRGATYLTKLDFSALAAE